ncbi:unnamed protein product [Lasius platythorax]|uniref:Secreted protein n=1 Tax=Lasius platythorax TaxID=488582 RepID=A0AAV2NJP4_9HYME
MILVNLFVVLITDSTANSFPLLVVCHSNFSSSSFSREKSVAREQLERVLPGVIICEEKSGIARDRQDQNDLGNVLAWRHVSVYALARRGGKREWP